MASESRILAICAGVTRPLFVRESHDDQHLHQTLSGIAKTPISTLQDPRAVMCKHLGIDGDEQADLTVHGGPDKAVYCYPAGHYAFWTRKIPALAQRSLEELFGQVGENLTIDGVDETQIWIEDDMAIGEEVILKICKPREPCFKFNARMGDRHASKLMMQHDICGWYCAVVREGTIKAGDRVVVRPGPRYITVARANQRLTRPDLL
jgi:MOSC domain-containing protein YiiM